MTDVLRVTRAARRLGRVLSAIAAEPVQEACGLSLKELMMLRAFEGESAHPHELGDRTGTAAPLVTRALDRLSELGYVEREPDTADRRRVVVAVTAAGADASAAGWDALGEVLQRAFHDVPAGAFVRLAENMEELSQVAEAQHDTAREAVGGEA